MSTRPAQLAKVAEILNARPDQTPWLSGDTATFVPDDDALRAVLGVPVSAKAVSQGGLLAKTLDAWIAHEIRRAGFDPDAVWPRRTLPNVLPDELATLLSKARKTDREVLEKLIASNPGVAPADAVVLGRAFLKQVDVVMASWSRGPEILISTKTMTASFANNLASRFEEAYGDAKNLRGRHPMAAVGFVFLMRGTIQDDRNALARATDMLRKLRAESDVYDATSLIIADWADSESSVAIRNDVVPTDLRAGQFFATIVQKVLERTPVSLHEEARRRLNASLGPSPGDGGPD